MALTAELSKMLDLFHQTAPKDAVTTIDNMRTEFRETYDPTKAIQPGSHFPAFTLPSATGTSISSTDLLAKGPLLIAFYRGSWCPYCNLELRALQKHLPDFEARGVQFVAISGEVPDQSLNTAEKNDLKFPVLSDVDLKLARQLGIVVKQPDDMRPVFEKFDIDLEKHNGSDTMDVPVPATFLVDQQGVLRKSFVDADYTTRLEPATALKWIDELK